MKMSGKLYEVLKWLTLIALPAASTLYAALGAVWHFPCVKEISTTVAAVCAFIGTLIGISTAAYRREEDEHRGS